ncbi:MAG: FtsX-like permease family protein, partial [Gammaproteobacteria bacterium]
NFVAVLSMVLMGAFMRAWSRSALVETINNLTGHGQIHAPGYLDDPSVDHRIHQLPVALQQTLAQAPIVHMAQRVRVPAMLKTERESAPVELYGIQPRAEEGLSFIADAVIDGRYFQAPDERGILLGAQLAKRLQTQRGRRLLVLSQGIDGTIQERAYPIIGIFSATSLLEKTTVYLTLPQAQSLLQMGSDISEIAYRLDHEDAAAAVARTLASQAPNLQVLAWDALQPFTKAMLKMSDGSMLIWILVSFGVVSFGLMNTLLMAVFERVHEFGLLQALGMRPQWLLLQLLMESTWMIGLATGLGLIVGVVLVLSAADGINLGIGASYLGVAQVVYPRVDAGEVALIGGSVLVLGLLTSLYPAIKAASQVPMEVLSKAAQA